MDKTDSVKLVYYYALDDFYSLDTLRSLASYVSLLGPKLETEVVFRLDNLQSIPDTAQVSWKEKQEKHCFGNGAYCCPATSATVPYVDSTGAKLPTLRPLILVGMQISCMWSAAADTELLGTAMRVMLDETIQGCYELRGCLHEYILEFEQILNGIPSHKQKAKEYESCVRNRWNLSVIPVCECVARKTVTRWFGETVTGGGKERFLTEMARHSTVVDDCSRKRPVAFGSGDPSILSSHQIQKGIRFRRSSFDFFYIPNSTKTRFQPICEWNLPPENESLGSVRKVKNSS